MGKGGLRAFALGGLGGFNAHSAGFIQASLDKEARGEAPAPALITCSSGAIWWVYRYLDIKHHRNKFAPDQLKREIADQAEKSTGLNGLAMAAFGERCTL